MDFQPYWS